MNKATEKKIDFTEFQVQLRCCLIIKDGFDNEWMHDFYADYEENFGIERSVKEWAEDFFQEVTLDTHSYCLVTKLSNNRTEKKTAEEILNEICPNRPWEKGGKTDAMILKCMQTYAAQFQLPDKEENKTANIESGETLEEAIEKLFEKVPQMSLRDKSISISGAQFGANYQASKSERNRPDLKDENDALYLRINELEIELSESVGKDNWIRVEDELPQSDGRYLCYYTTRQDKIPHISILSWKRLLGFNGQFIVTHYQPLPTPPTI